MCLFPHLLCSLSISLSLSLSACRLYVAGHGLAPGFWCEQSIMSFSSPLSERSEEVYEAEGSIEEFLAYDGKEM